MSDKKTTNSVPEVKPEPQKSSKKPQKVIYMGVSTKEVKRGTIFSNGVPDNIDKKYLINVSEVGAYMRQRKGRRG